MANSRAMYVPCSVKSHRAKQRWQRNTDALCRAGNGSAKHPIQHLMQHPMQIKPAPAQTVMCGGLPTCCCCWCWMSAPNSSCIQGLSHAACPCSSTSDPSLLSSAGRAQVARQRAAGKAAGRQQSATNPCILKVSCAQAERTQPPSIHSALTAQHSMQSTPTCVGVIIVHVIALAVSIPLRILL